jgi:hypothetical protein
MPPAWLVLLFQHVARGPGGLANYATLSQTCKFLHSLSEGPGVTYSNLLLATAISSPDHSFWKWLAKRSGRIAGLTLELRLGTLDDATDQLRDWVQPLQTLSSIPFVQLRVQWVGLIDDLDHPFIAQWRKQHDHLISHLTLAVDVSQNWLKLKDFSEVVAPCGSIDLTICHWDNPVIDLAGLNSVAGSLRCLTFEPNGVTCGSLVGASAFNNMSHLIALHLQYKDFGIDEPWGSLAKLTSLQELTFTGRAIGDPSPLSALKELTHLDLQSLDIEGDDPAPFSFSSLQPLSPLQQLEELHLGRHAFNATSLHGLAGLSNLKVLKLDIGGFGGRLKSLEGISPWVVHVSMADARRLQSLAGIEGCASMEKLTLEYCGVSSLQPLGVLSSLKELVIDGCGLTSLEGLNSMSLQSLSLTYCKPLVQLSGVKHLSTLRSLEVRECYRVTSLQPLYQLGEGLQRLCVYNCTRVQEEVLELPHVQPTAEVVVVNSNVREVVLAGGERRDVGHPHL